MCSSIFKLLKMQENTIVLSRHNLFTTASYINKRKEKNAKYKKQ